MSGDEKSRSVDAYFDLRSPYSYLAIGPARELERESSVKFEWWPFITDFQSAYGGEIHERSARDVSKLKYLYMDCRRLAERQGLVIRATTKLWDASLASRAVLFANCSGRLWEFCLPLLSAFWSRKFDLESATDVESALDAAGLSVADWRAYDRTEAELAMQAVLDRAAAQGVFGAPSFVYREELFWGGDRLALLAERLGVDLQPQAV